MAMIIHCHTPLDESKCKEFRAGDEILLSGEIFTARDAAHQRLLAYYQETHQWPIPIKNQMVYYAGPTPSAPHHKVGSIGPTTSSRMDHLSRPLLENGLKGMIGKGERSKEFRSWMIEFSCIYFVTIGGAGSYLSKKVEDMKLLMYEDLGPEAIYILKVKEFPLFVAYDCYGGSIFK